MINIDKAQGIKGWMSSRELVFLAEVASRSTIIVEFGSYCGRSTRALADNTDGFVISIDPWNGEYRGNDGQLINILDYDAFDQFKRNLRDHLESGICIMFKMKAEDFPDPVMPFADFVFLDGDHRYAEVKKDIAIAERITKSGKIIAGHDYGRSDWPGVKVAVDEVYGDNIKVVDTIWWTQKS